MIDKLHYISQENESHSHLQTIEQALIAGCKWIQLRIKNQSMSNILAQAKQARTLCDKYAAKLIINDYLNIVLACSADGLHLGLQDDSIAEARKILGPEIIIGGTANTFDDIQKHIKEGADYIGIGPFRYTSTKAKLSPILGIPGYQKIKMQMNAKNLNIPLIAIGGILPSDIEAIKAVGLYGVAISAAIAHADNRMHTVKKIYSELNYIQNDHHNKKNDVNYSR